MDVNISGLRIDVEGERGGHVVGHTSSGKPIYQSHKHPSHRQFSEEEHYHAWKLQDDIAYHASDARSAVKQMRTASGQEGGGPGEADAKIRIKMARKAAAWHYGRYHEMEYGEPHPHPKFKDYQPRRVI